MEEESQSPSFRPALIGRDDELNRLKELYDNTELSKGTTVFIKGEAGIGKTRLVEELMEHAEDTTIIKGWCLPDILEPLMPFKEALRNADLHHFISEDPPPRIISTYLIDSSGLLITKAQREETELDADIFASMLGAVQNYVSDSLATIGDGTEKELNTIHYGGYQILIQSTEELSLAAVIEGTNNEFLIDDMKETLSEIGERFDSWEGDLKEADVIRPQIEWYLESKKYEGSFLVDDPKIKQENLFDNVLMGLKRLSKDSPVILYLDDLQWADPTSLNLLHYLARNTRNNQILIMGSYRPEDIVTKTDEKTHPLKTTLQNMSREGLFEEIELERLDTSAVEALINDVLEGSELDESFLTSIHKESEGNPFFLLEVMKMLVEEGHLKKEDGSWTVQETMDHVHLPSKVYDVVVRRLDRLLKEQRDLLECASIIGEEFESGIVGDVTGVNRIELLKNLNKIERAHNLIHSIEKKYRFDHSKIREVLYQGINDELRQEYHRVVAESYEELYENDKQEVVEHIAHHFHRSGDERAIEYLIDAGDKAKDSYANEEAVRFYQNSLSHIKDEPNKRPYRAYRGLGDVYRNVGRYEEALDSYDKAVDAAEDIQDKAELYGSISQVYTEKGAYDEALEYAEKGLSSIDEDNVVRCRLLNKKGGALQRKGEYDQAADIFKEERGLADSLGEIEEKAQSLHELGTVKLHKGDYDKAEEYLQDAIEIWEEIENKKKLGASYNNIGIVHYEKGDLDKALECYQKNLETKEEIGNKQGIALTLNNIGNIHWGRGDLDEALACHERSLKIVREIGDENGIAHSLTNMGNIHWVKGNIDEAVDYYERTLEINERIGDQQNLALTLNNMGNAYLHQGALGKAMSSFSRGLQISRKIGAKRFSIHLLYGLANTQTKKGDIEKAEKNAEEAIQMSVDMEAKSEQGIGHRVKGVIYREKEALDRAEVEFEKALEILEEAGDTGELAQTHHEYGLLFKTKGETEKAKTHLEEALQMFKEVNMGLWIDKTKKVLEEV